MKKWKLRAIIWLRHTAGGCRNLEQTTSIKGWGYPVEYRKPNPARQRSTKKHKWSYTFAGSTLNCVLLAYAIPDLQVIWTSESLILPFLTPRPNCSSLTLMSWLPDLHLVLGHIELLTPRSSFPDSQITGLTQTLTAVWLSPDPLLAQPKPAAAHTTASQTLPGEGLTFFTETISIIWNFCQSGNCSAADIQGHSRIKQHIVS